MNPTYTDSDRIGIAHASVTAPEPSPEHAFRDALAELIGFAEEQGVRSFIASAELGWPVETDVPTYNRLIDEVVTAARAAFGPQKLPDIVMDDGHFRDLRALAEIGLLAVHNPDARGVGTDSEGGDL